MTYLNADGVKVDESQRTVTLYLEDPCEWGTYKVEMTPDEARVLALRLIRRADQVDP